MAKLRKGVCYRRIDKRPYTRVSKYRAKSYIRTTPNIKLVRFDMGDTHKQYPLKVQLVARQPAQIRHQALESARQVTNRVLEKNWGRTGFRFTMRVYPHHILRENPIASGAGADRMSTGMKFSFGKPIGSAARVHDGKVVMEVQVPNLTNATVAKMALKRANTKLGCKCQVVITENPKADAAA